MKVDNLRVALFTGNYNYTRDGPTQAMNRLVGYLLSQGASVRVYSPTSHTPAFQPTGDLVSVRSIPFPAGRDEYKLALALSAATKRDILAFRPNTLHIATPDPMGFSALRLGRKLKILTVASMHTRFETYLSYYGLGFLQSAAIRLQARFYSRVDEVLLPSNSMGEVLRSWGVKTPMSVWSRGVDSDLFNVDRRSLEWRRSIGIEDDTFVIGFLGRVVMEKGLDVFVAVVRRLEEFGVKIRALVIGDGPSRAWMEAQLPSAIFCGLMSGDELGRGVASMDIFLNPSETETFGNVTLEACAAGVPVVAARATGTKDIVTNGQEGFLVEPRNIEAFADACLQVINNPALRSSLVAAARAKATNYKWTAVNQAVVDIYLQLLRDRQAQQTGGGFKP